MKISSHSILIVGLLSYFTPVLAADPAPPLPTIIERVIARDEANQKQLGSMSYHEALRSEQLDANGKVTKHQDVQMIIRPDAVNEVQVLSAKGDDLPADPDEAAQKARGQEARRKNMKFPLREIAQRFHISRAGDEVMEGQPVYVIAFEPKPNQPYSNQTEKVLNQLHGKMWISTKDYSVLQTDATLAQPVEVAWFFAQISRLDFHYELHNTDGGMGPAVVRTFVVVDAPFITIRQRMTVDMTQFRSRVTAGPGN